MFEGEMLQKGVSDRKCSQFAITGSNRNAGSIYNNLNNYSRRKVFEILDGKQHTYQCKNVLYILLF
jgi:hypothetical protein